MKTLSAALLISVLAVGAFAAPLSPLRVEGPEIVNAEGETVVLTGTNIGGWLMHELWITQWQPESMMDDWGIRQTLGRRLAPDQASELLNLHWDVYFTEEDVQRLASLGMNHLRIPFNYLILEDDDRTFEYRDEGWARLDWIVEQCRENELYCMLDMHGASGRQSRDHTSGRSDLNGLWFAGDAGDRAAAHFQERLIRMWMAIAERYRDQPHVLFNIVNEPVGAPSAEALVDLHGRCHDAIRSVGAEQIILMELYAWETSEIRAWVSPEEQGWRNVVLQFHPYTWEAFDTATQSARADDAVRNFSAIRDELNVPFYFGEWQGHTPEATDHAMWTFNTHGFSWAHWNWRVWWQESLWGIDYRSGALAQIPNFEADDFETLRAKLTTYTRENYTDNAALVDIFRHHCRDGASVPLFGIPEPALIDLADGHFSVHAAEPNTAVVVDGRARVMPPGRDWGRVPLRLVPEEGEQFPVTTGNATTFSFIFGETAILSTAGQESAVIRFGALRDPTEEGLHEDTNEGLICEFVINATGEQVTLRVRRKEAAGELGNPLNRDVVFDRSENSMVEILLDETMVSVRCTGETLWIGPHDLPLAEWGGTVVDLEVVNFGGSRLGYVDLDEFTCRVGDDTEAFFSESFDQTPIDSINSH